jgi:MoxR-like ATPase
LLETTGDTVAAPTQALNAGELETIQRLVRRLPVGDAIVDAILDLVRAARPNTGDPEIAPHIAWGPGPRAAQALMLATRARALATGRLAPSLDDVAALAPPVLRHRMALNFSARRDMSVEDIIRKLVARIG